eukprot:TRINITY_DN18354_c0_g1_i2.p1 TRINITY_DN18354_c0_g1~~TRINITY_DN18354_c0_g1_i2.p1  ORF type:complete len:109 (-),score=2.26 TRINITY_DN18354_c0_g1_i2:22-348(-)
MGVVSQIDIAAHEVIKRRDKYVCEALVHVLHTHICSPFKALHCRYVLRQVHVSLIDPLFNLGFKKGTLFLSSPRSKKPTAMPPNQQKAFSIAAELPPAVPAHKPRAHC